MAPKTRGDGRYDINRKEYYYGDSTGKKKYGKPPPTELALGGSPSNKRDSANPSYQYSGSPSSPSRSGQPPPSRSSGEDATLSTAMSGMSLISSSPPSLQIQKDSFYKRGRVFAVSLEGNPSPETHSGHTVVMEISTGSSQRVSARTRRYVVLRGSARDQVDHCLVLPISTYGGYGVARNGVVKADHGIIHSGKHEPPPTRDEFPGRGEDTRGMCSVALKVDMRLPSEKLDSMSRVNYRHPILMHKGSPVHNLGMLDEDSISWLDANFKAVQERNRASRPAEEDEDEDEDEREPNEENDTSYQSTNALAVQARQAQEAYERMRAQGLTQEQAVRALADALRREKPEMTLDVALASARGRLRYRNT